MDARLFDVCVQVLSKTTMSTSQSLKVNLRKNKNIDAFYTIYIIKIFNSNADRKHLNASIHAGCAVAFLKKELGYVGPPRTVPF
jgi:hypothetical protein